MLSCTFQFSITSCASSGEQKISSFWRKLFRVRISTRRDVNLVTVPSGPMSSNRFLDHEKSISGYLTRRFCLPLKSREFSALVKRDERIHLTRPSRWKIARDQRYSQQNQRRPCETCRIASTNAIQELREGAPKKK